MKTNTQVELTGVGVYFLKPRKTRSLVNEQALPGDIAQHQRKDWALTSIDLSSTPGETIGILGRNGAGKTTLLRILEGTLMPDVGKCTATAKPVSMSSLMSGFHGPSSVLENVKTLGRLRGVPAKDAKAFALEVAEFAGLSEKIYHPHKSLSTGMKARLGFSFAHIFEPDVLLIDEGFANGDLWFREKSQKSIARYLASGKTIFMTSHSEKFLTATCSRGLVLKDGKLLFDGPINQAVEVYRTKG